MTGSDIIVVKDCICKQYQDYIEREIKNPEFSWTLLKDVTSGNDASPGTEVLGLANSPMVDGQVQNTLTFSLMPLLYEAAAKANLSVSSLIRIRIGTYFNTGQDIHTHNNVHVDDNRPHMVGLYYPYDTDGNTLFFDNLAGDNIIKENKPEKGTMIFFDGSTPHASSNPINYKLRCTINFNFT